LDKERESKMNDEPTKRDYLVVLIVGLTLLIGCGLMLWINWNSTTILGGIGRVFGGLLEFVGGVITFNGIAQGRSLYLSGTINGVKQNHPFWHKDTDDEIKRGN
jgi:hypothetical protein